MMSAGAMNIGLIGLQKSGKTTIFNTLTGRSAEVSEYVSQKAQPNVAVVEVLDERVTKLAEIYRPKRTIYATIEFVDFAGLAAGAAGQGVFSGEAMQLIKGADALAIVARNFHDEVINQTHGEPQPSLDAEAIATELLLADQIVAERRLERIRADLQRGKKTAALPNEEKLIERVVTHLAGGRPLRELELTADDRKLLSGFQFLTAKPVFVVLNSSEETYGNSAETISAIEEHFPVVEFAGNFEMELGRLDDEEESAAFMAEFGIGESARRRLTTFAYRTLGYISFFTVRSNEVRAWTLPVGGTAVDAAAAVHTDLARGFIRAEVFSYDELMEHGSEKALRAAGRLRVEGKSYIVEDGDIINVRFSV